MSETNMNNHPQEREWRERFWRDPATAAREESLPAWLAAHPEAKADLQAEATLTEAMRRLPDVPLPSNFTSRVLQAARAGEKRNPRLDPLPLPFWRRFRWATGLAATALAIFAGIVSYQRIEAISRAKILDSVLIVSEVPSRPSPEVLEDLDSIRRLTPSVAPDEELIALMQ
jgi:hypothetical protein